MPKISKTGTSSIKEKWGNVTWTVTPATAGTIVFMGSTNKIQFHAGLDAGIAVIKAVPDKTCTENPLLERTFTIKAPTLVYFKGCDLHLANRYSSGIKLESYLMPDDVSFHNISYQEEDVLSIGWAAWKPFGGKHHIPVGAASPWIGCNEIAGGVYNIITGRGTHTGFYDTAYFDPKNGYGSTIDGLTEWVASTPGSVTFVIPSKYAKYDAKGITRNLLPIITQTHTMTAPSIGTSKGGVIYNVQLTDPSTPTQWTDADCN